MSWLSVSTTRYVRGVRTTILDFVTESLPGERLLTIKGKKNWTHRSEGSLQDPSSIYHTSRASHEVVLDHRSGPHGPFDRAAALAALRTIACDGVSVDTMEVVLEPGDPISTAIARVEKMPEAAEYEWVARFEKYTLTDDTDNSFTEELRMFADQHRLGEDYGVTRLSSLDLVWAIPRQNWQRLLVDKRGRLTKKERSELARIREALELISTADIRSAVDALFMPGYVSGRQYRRVPGEDRWELVSSGAGV